MNVRERMRPWIGEISNYVPGEYREGYVKLASNENNYGPSPKVVEALRQWSGRTQIYPYRGEELREKLAEYVGVKKENIVCGNGSDELIDLVVKAFKGPNAGSYPSFAEYPIVSRINGEKYTPVKLEDDFAFNAEKFLAGAGDCNLMFLCTPNNPTGLSIPEGEIMKVVESGKIVVVDEAYYEFSGKTVVGRIRDNPNMIVLRTMAKSFALAGLRIGYAVADPEVIEALLKVKPPFNVNTLAEAAAIAALDDIEYMEETVKKVKLGKEAIYKALKGKFKPLESDSNFVFADVTPMTSEEFAEKLLEARITVRRFGKLEGYPGDYVRVNAGTEEENMKFAEALSKM
ncbi:MAG: histidinol-phosphate transaminase [Candidatus Altiarchaeales archaeon]|nr:histidinol-phosphate transaminase [Candidatus Altiarchaeales archaeon]MBD3416614.1 histidinol-phosphate transaminase [Candidatus Altiarchaeales archaeon]